MEHKVYLCGWRRNSEGFCLWTKSKPVVRAEAQTYRLAEERLLEEIRAHGGAMHAVLEFDRSLPRSEQESKYSSPELYLISGDDRFETDTPPATMFETEQQRDERIAWLNSFYEKPVCRKCGSPTAPRSQRPLTLTYAPSRQDGAFGHVGKDGGTWIEIVSEDFLSLLSPQELKNLSFRPVTRKAGSRKFYELLGPDGPAFVAVAGLKLQGWRCSGCSFGRWGYWTKGFSIHSFVAASDLPKPLPGIFTVGTSQRIHLCATATRWREFVGKKGVRGFASHPLGVVSDRELIRQPELPTKEENLAKVQRT